MSVGDESVAFDFEREGTNLAESHDFTTSTVKNRISVVKRQQNNSTSTISKDEYLSSSDSQRYSNSSSVSSNYEAGDGKTVNDSRDQTIEDSSAGSGNSLQIEDDHTVSINNESIPAPVSNVEESLGAGSSGAQKYDSTEVHDDGVAFQANPELDEYESFFPDESSVLEKSIYANDNADELIKKATEYSTAEKLEKKDTLATIADDDGGGSVTSSVTAGMGARKEKQLIDSLKQENFQLKLKIVFMEGQLISSSNEGVGELQKQLIDVQAMRLALQHENSKLRTTISELNKSKERDNEKREAELFSKIKTLEEHVRFYEEECDSLRKNFEAAEQNYKVKELDLASQYDRALDEERGFSAELRDRCVQLEHEMEDYKVVTMRKVMESLNDSNNRPLSGSGDNTTRRSAGSSRQTHRYTDSISSNSNNNNSTLFSPTTRISQQVENIKRSLSPLAYPQTPSRSRLSGRTSSSLQESTLYESNSNLEVVEDALRQIQEAANSHGASHALLQQDYNALQRDLQNLEEDYNSIDRNFEAMLAELRTNHDLELNELEDRLEQKQRELEDALDENADLEDALREIKQSVIDLEGLKRENDNVSSRLNAKEDELTNLRLIKNDLQLESNSKASEIQNLKIQVEQIQKSEDKANYMKLDYESILNLVKSSFDEHTNNSNLVTNIGKAFSTLSDMETTVRQADEVVSENMKLSGELTEKSKQIENLKEKISNTKSELEREIAKVKQEREAECQNKLLDIQKLEDKANEFKIEIDNMRSTKSEFVTKISSLESKITKKDQEIEKFSQDVEQQTSINSQLTDEVKLKTKQLEENVQARKNLKNDLDRSLKKLQEANAKINRWEELKQEEFKEMISEISRLKQERRDAINRAESTKRLLEQQRLDQDLLSSEAKALREQLYFESQKSESLEKQLKKRDGRLGTHSSSAAINSSSPINDVSQTFRSESYQRLIELQNTLEQYQKTQASDVEKIKSLEVRLQQSRDENFNILNSIFQKLEPILPHEWLEKISQEIDALQTSSVNSARGNSKYKSLAILMIEALASITNIITQNRNRLKQIEYKYLQLKQERDKLVSSHSDNETIATLQYQVDTLQRELESINNKLNEATDELERERNKGDGTVVIPDVIRQVSGTFVGKLWIARYHEMERKWHDERERRKLEYDAYTEHLRECHDEIETQKKAIANLQVKLKDYETLVEKR